MIGYVAVAAAGYVMGTKAGRRRYEQIVGTYRAVTGSPIARSAIAATRRKIANTVSPDAPMVKLVEIDATTTVVEPEQRDVRR